MKPEQRQFFAALGYEGDALPALEIRVLDRAPSDLPDPGGRPRDDPERWRRIDEENASGANVFFGVAHRNAAGGTARHVTAAWALWADIDGKTINPTDPKNGVEKALETLRARLPAHLQPSILVASGHGVHAYWLLVEPWEFGSYVRRVEFEDVLRGIAVHLDGDRKCCDIARVLRVPGTMNMKDKANPRPCEILVFEPTRRLTPDDLTEVVRPVHDLRLEFAAPAASTTPTASAEVAAALDAVPFTTATGGIKFAECRAIVPAEALDKIPQGERNSTLFQLACRMRRAGLTEREAAAAVLVANNGRSVPPIDAAEVARIVRSAFRYEVTPDEKTGGGDDDRISAYKFRFYTATEVMAWPPPRWLVDRVLVANALNVIYGAPGSCKTFAALDLALTLCAGRPWHGRAIEPVNAAFIAGEGGAGIKVRMAAWLQHARLSVEAIPGFRVVNVPISPFTPGDVARFVLEGEEQLGEGATPGLVVFDTLSRCFVGGDENSTEDMALFVEAIARICAAFNCAALVLHHVGKDASRGERGNTALRGGADLMILSEKQAEPGAAGPGSATLTPDKAKEFELPPPIALTLPVVYVEGVGSSCVVSEVSLAETPADVPEPATRQRREAIVAFLQERLEPESVSAIKRAVGGRVETVRADLAALTAAGTVIESKRKWGKGEKQFYALRR